MIQRKITTEENSRKVLEKLPAPLLRWFRVHARDLPWRRTKDPYRIWVSEIMLQQTRVAAVLGYYDRFLSAFPSVEVLAAAPEERLFKLWEGLGYYSRARNLQKTARILTERYGGKFPRTYRELLALPGIGDYTASAIVSAAFGVREPAVDGNVLRAVARLTDCHRDIMNSKVRRAVRAAVGIVMPQTTEDIRIFNQATMELGAVVCVPNGPPKCRECPAREFCLGRLRGSAASLPVRAPKKARRVEEKTVYVLQRDDGRVALRRRPDSGLLAGLWEFPNVSGNLEGAQAQKPLEAWGLTPRTWYKKLTAKHLFTHVEWHMIGYSLRVSGAGPDEFLWADKAVLDKYAIPSAFAKYNFEARTLMAEINPLPETEKDESQPVKQELDGE